MNEAGATQPAPARLSTAPAAVLVSAGLLLLTVAAVCAALWRHWSGNADLSHGLLMPVVFIYLIHEARCSGVRRYTNDSTARRIAGLALASASLLLGLAGCLYASALGWGHALSAAFTGAGLTALLLLALLNLSDRRLRLVPVNWQALCAALLWLLTVPLPPGAYARLSGSLQQGVSQTVLLALNLMGIPATRQGNIIELTHGRVGVEEACSGVRSLIGCIFAALLISALVVRSPWRRALLVMLAPLLALGMNLLRSLTLTLLSNGGIDINGAWHDNTGYAILALTALILFWIAQKLESRTRPAQAPLRIATARPAAPSATPKAPLLLVACSCSGMLAVVQFSLLLLPRLAAQPLPPDLERAIPLEVPGWTQEGNPDLRRFGQILHTEHLLERSYTRGVGKERIQVTVYAAAWEAGTSTPAEISLHTPEVCWPGVGWTQVPTTSESARLPAGARALSFDSPRGERQQVVYWLLYDGEPVVHLDPYVPLELMRLALRYGHRAPAPQVFVRISGNRPYDELLRLPPVREALHALGISDLSP